MKVLKSIVLLLFLCVNNLLFAQKNYYKDTLFEFNGYKFEIIHSFSTEKSFKGVVIITNPTDNYLIINPWDIYGYVSSQGDKSSMARKKTIVVAPKYTKKFTVLFKEKNYLSPNVHIDFSKIQVTDKLESVYDFPDIPLYKENYSKVGNVIIRIGDIDVKKVLDVECFVQYTGNKFLSIYYNNISLKTADGKVFYNVSKKTGDFHYDMDKPQEKNRLVFPINPESAIEKNSPILSFKGVFKEYSTHTIVGPSFIITQGTIEDFNGKGKKSDIEEIEE